jgi:hypothetical protein
MTERDGFSVATAYVDVTADTIGVETACRVIAKHLTAMADELETVRVSREAAQASVEPAAS